MEKKDVKAKYLSSEETPEKLSAPENENIELLRQLEAKDIQSNFEYKKENRLLKDATRFLLLLLFACTFVFSVYKVVSSIIGYKQADDFYSTIRDMFYSGEIAQIDESFVLHMQKPSLNDSDKSLSELLGEASGEISSKEEEDEFDLMLSNIDALSNITRNAYGWIKIDGTRVDYPLVQGKDNEYYLTHSIDGTFLVAGSIYVDCNNSKKISNNKNTVIYGHNMNDGTMFKSLTNFRDVNMFNNGEVKVYTKDGIFIFKPFSIYEALPQYPFFRTEFSSEEDFSEFIADVSELSWYSSKQSVGADDNILTLMTCTNTAINNRLVIHCVLTDTVK